MAEEATAVNDSGVQQDTSTTDSAPVEDNSPEVADPILDVLSSDDDAVADTKPETEDKPQATEEVTPDEPVAETKDEEQSRGEDKPLAPKSENRFQKLANENRDLKEYIEKLHNEVYKPQSVEELVDEGLSPELAEVRSLKQSLEISDYNNKVVDAQVQLSNESASILSDYGIFNPDSPDFQPDLAASAAEALEKSLIVDPNTGQIIGSHISPTQIYKPIADAYQKSIVRGQIQGQKATERMLASVDTPTSLTPKTPKTDPIMDILTSDD